MVRCACVFGIIGRLIAADAERKKRPAVKWLQHLGVAVIETLLASECFLMVNAEPQDLRRLTDERPRLQLKTPKLVSAEDTVGR